MDERMKGALGILAALAITALVFILSPEIAKLGSLGYIGAFFISLLSSATIVIPAPGLAIVMAMGRTLNPVLLGVTAGIGAGIGEMTGYLLGYGGREIIEGNKHKQFLQHKEWLKKYDVLAIFALAAIPNPVFDLAGIAAGALKMPPWKFLLACVAGNVVKFVVFAHFGLWSKWIF